MSARARFLDTSVGRLLRQVREDYHRHDAELTRAGFQALAVHRVATWAAERPRLVAAPLLALCWVLYVFVRNVYGVELPRTTKVGRRLRLAHQSGIVIHPHAVIGDDCTIRQNVTIGGVHPSRWEVAPTLGDRVEIGAGAVLIGKLTVGDDARIGPNVVLTTSVPAGARVFVPQPRVILAQPAQPTPGGPLRAARGGDGRR